MKVMKRMFAALLTFVMLLGLFPNQFAPAAYAEVHTENNGIGLGGNNAVLINRFTANTGTLYGINNHQIGGVDAFCLDPTIGSEVGTQYSYSGTGASSSSVYWNLMSEADKRLIAGIAVYYANNPYAGYLTPDMGHQPATIAKVGAQYAVFSSVIANPETLNSRVDDYAWGDVKLYAAEAISWAQSQTGETVTVTLPSFDGQKVELIYDPVSEMYVGSVTDLNGALVSEGYDFSQTVSGVQVVQSGNTVTITATPAAAAAAGLQNNPNSWAVSSTVTKSSNTSIDLGAIKIHERPGDQPLLVYEPGSGENPETVTKTATLGAYAHLIGSAKVLKTSADTAISGSNRCYTLSGAIYAVYESEAEAQAEINALAMITTDANGESETVDLAAGTYYLKELSAPRGFALNTEIVPFSVSAGETATVRVSDVPTADPVPILLRKIDGITGLPRPAGGMSLAGAEYAVMFYGGQYGSAAEAEASGNPMRSWVLRTDEDGYADLRDPSYVISGDELWYSASGEISLPLGSVVIYETKAPAGYRINDTHYIVNITEDGQSSSVVRTYNAPEIPEEPYFGSVMVRKVDAEHASEQGDATLAGAVFGLVNENSQSVTINGVETLPGEIALLIETNADGLAVSDQVIPYGTYSLREVQPSEGYALNSEWSSEIFTISVEGQIVDAGICEETVLRGGIAIQKLDADTLAPVPQGDATLEGAEIQIKNASDGPVIVNGISYGIGDVITSVTTNDQGIAETEENLLPYGRYELVETRAPRGYGVNLDWNPIVEVHEDSQILVAGAYALIDDVARGDVSFIKVDGTNMHRLQNIPFMITSKTTGESHIIVTDENGSFNSAALDKTINVNGNDAAMAGESINETKLDSSIGVWFSGAGSASAPRNEKGAFPYDTYVFQELQTNANAMYEMVSFEVTVTNDGQLVDLGTVDNNPIPHVTTLLLDKDTNDHIAAIGAVTLNERVDYYALRTDKTYEIVGTLVDRDSGIPVSANGETVRVSTGVFRPDSSDGVVTLTYSFETAELEGKTVVSTVELIEDGVRIYSDNNLENPDETVRFPSIRTAAHGENGEKEFPSEGYVKVIDTVTYSNLIPGTTYVAAGQLVDVSTAKAPIGTDGNVILITAETSFRAETESGSVDIEFNFDASKLSGGTLVAFESLFRNSVLIAEHKDTGDVDQTIAIPRVATRLLGTNDSHTVPAASEISLTDYVTYSGLQPRASYLMSGILMDKATSERAKDAYGQDITASRSFVAEPSGTGTVELTFVFNGSNMAGTAVVAFEDIIRDGYTVCGHADLNDEDQTVWFPGIRTNAFGGGEDKEVFATENGVITDTVAYWALIPGVEYTLTGALMDKSTGETARDPNGIPIVETIAFMPESKDGSVNIVFEADLSELAGHTLVVFETLSQKDEVLAEHKDLSDPSQTVTLPKIWTLAHNEDGSHEMLAENQITIIDTVMYENLIPGKRYTVSGTLMDKLSEKPVRDRNGDTVTAVSTFEADAANGSVDVTFVFEAANLKNSTLVAFERLSNEVSLVSVHEDIDDDDQTIRIPEIGTTLLSESGMHVAPLKETVRLTDTVEYRNLKPGNTYTVTGVLVEKATGNTVLDSDGRQIASSKEFIAENADGAVELTFSFNSKDMSGRAVIAYEELSNRYGIIATHKDLTDENQTVYIPEIQTAAAGENGEKEFFAEGNQTIVDTVSFTGLLPCTGKDYRLIAALMDKATGREVINADGTPVTAEVSFEAKSTEGQIEVPIRLDGCDRLAGHEIVVFETLHYKGEVIAEHKDIDDADQTVVFPAIETALTTETGEHVSYPGAFDENGTLVSLTLTDTVRYEKLIPGTNYRVEGTLMNKKTGQAYRDKNANHVTASATFTPENPNGEVQLVFVLAPEQIEPDELTENTLIAFETLYRNERTVAEHKDLEDESQSIHFPSIRTKARAEDGTQTAVLDFEAAEVEITDAVTYKNLVPGLTYKMVGTLMDKETHGILREPDGSPIIAETIFETETGDGEISVRFRFDARNVIGKNAVVFESLMIGQTMIAEHKDINDEEQTIQFPHQVRMFKYDASDRRGLEGAEFRIEDKGLSNSGEPVMLLAAQIVTSDGDGYFYFNSLPGHQYSITELKAPTGYITASAEYVINVGEDGTIEGDTEIPNVHGGTVVITKTDVITGTPLSGCEISVYKVTDESTDRRELVFKQTTDGKGRIYFYTLDKGTYVYKETATREGYYLNEEEYVFKINADGSVEGDTRIKNVPFGTVVIKKVDSEGKPLAGAQLAFYDANNRYLGQGVSDAKGRIYFVSPGSGEYFFTEIKAPEGYGLATERYRFQIGADYAISGTLKLVNTRTSTPYSKTGDSQHLEVWIGVAAGSLVFAGCAAAVILARKKKKTR